MSELSALGGWYTVPIIRLVIPLGSLLGQMLIHSISNEQLKSSSSTVKAIESLI
jgi:hypothetical protein